MKEEITRENLADFLTAYLTKNNVSIENIAKSFGCSKATIERIIKKETYPTDNLLKQCAILFAIEYKLYKKLSKADKEKISEKIGAVGGGVLGFGGITAAISASGTVIGLSAAGITSGLSGIGALVGGGMVAGATAVAAIPIAIGTVGYGLTKGVKTIITHYKLNNKEINNYWEIRR